MLRPIFGRTEKTETLTKKETWVCSVCGYVYDGETPFESFGLLYLPLCNVSKENSSKNSPPWEDFCKEIGLSMKLGSHVGMSAKEMLLGSIKEAVSTVQIHLCSMQGHPRIQEVYQRN